MSKEERIFSNKENDCARLDYLDSLGYYGKTYVFFVYKMGEVTGHNPRMFKLDGMGANYSHDSIFINDVKRWKRYLDCDEK